MSFVHLHLHTEYSLLNGTCRLKNLIEHVKKTGQNAVAITDFCNLFGAVKFFRECRRQNIKPIIGCEILIKNCVAEFEITSRSNGFKLIVLCENKTGYENLVKIVSFLNSNVENEVTAISFEFFKKHSLGLIVLSGDLNGEIFWGYSNFGFDFAKKIATIYCGILGRNNFFLQLQNHRLTQEQELNDCLKKIAYELNLGLVATNDVHYVERDEAKTQKILSCIKFSETMKQSCKSLPNDSFYLKTENEMIELFVDCKQAIKNTEKIANRCYFEFEFGKIKFLKFNSNSFEFNKKLLFKKAIKGLLKKYGNNPENIVLNRLHYEFNVVVKMGFVDYFLIVQDYVNYARKNSIMTGPGRGSGAGSLLAFCLNITAIDPIKYDLSFERFLNLGRKKMPDFDVDFCNERRQEVINYVIKKYGQKHVAQIVTFGTLAANAAVREVARVLRVGVKISNLMSKLITKAKLTANKYRISLDEALKYSDELKNLVKNDKTASLIFKFACRIEGLPKNTSIHASAVVLSSDELNKQIPIIKHENVFLTQYDMEDVSKLGFLKMDFLGLRNLTVIGECETLIKKNKPNFSVEKIELFDEKTFKLLSKGESVGVFQLESSFVRDILIRVKPKKLEDIMIVMTLYRPGPSRFIDSFVENREKPEKIKYLNKKMEKILKSTCGVVIYQEQVMQIFREIAGYSFEKIDVIREAISKKNLKLIEQERNFFLDGAKQSGIDAANAVKLYERLTNFSAYTFNKSHAAAYSLIAYQTAFLKVNYSIQYFTCLLNSVIFGDSDKLQLYLNECEKFKIFVKPISVNTSEVKFEILDDCEIAFSLLAIKGIGKKLAEQIVCERKKGLFNSIRNFFERMNSKNLTKIAVNSLIESGAFNEFENDLNQNLNFIENFFIPEIGIKKNELKGQLSLFDTQVKEQKHQNIKFIAEVRGKKQILFQNSKKTLLLNLFGEFKSFNCLFANNLLKNLNFTLNLNNFFMFNCIKLERQHKNFLIATNVVSLEQLKPSDLILILKIKIEELQNFKKLKILIKNNLGDSSIFFVFNHNKKYFQKQGYNKISITLSMLNKIKTLFGENSFKIVIKNKYYN